MQGWGSRGAAGPAPAPPGGQPEGHRDEQASRGWDGGDGAWREPEALSSQKTLCSLCEFAQMPGLLLEVPLGMDSLGDLRARCLAERFPRKSV